MDYPPGGVKTRLPVTRLLKIRTHKKQVCKGKRGKKESEDQNGELRNGFLCPSLIYLL